jgi:hypothetical protein
MHFQFVSDVDCESVVKRALAVGPPDLITHSLRDAIPTFEGIRIPEALKMGPDRPSGVPAPLSFGRVMEMLVDYFKSLHLKSDWTPVDKWRETGLEEGPAKVREVTEPDWNKIANFVVQYCRELLTAVGIPEPFPSACSECRRAIAQALRHRDQNLSSIVETAARELQSAIPPHSSPESASSDCSIIDDRAQLLPAITDSPAEPVTPTSSEFAPSGDPSVGTDLIVRHETVPEVLTDQCALDEGSGLVIVAAIPLELSDGAESYHPPVVPDTPRTSAKTL